MPNRSDSAFDSCRLWAAPLSGNCLGEALIFAAHSKDFKRATTTTYRTDRPVRWENTSGLEWHSCLSSHVRNTSYSKPTATVAFSRLSYFGSCIFFELSVPSYYLCARVSHPLIIPVVLLRLCENGWGLLEQQLCALEFNVTLQDDSTEHQLVFVQT